MFSRTKLSDRQRKSWENDGFVIVKNCFDAETMKSARIFLDELWTNRARAQSPLTIDAFLGTNDARSGRQHFKDVPDDARSFVYKLNDAYLESSFIRDLALDRKLGKTLSELVGEEPCICNSLIFERGSQQNLHRDTYYMPPPEGSTLIATSICLEDVDPDAGPVQYVPGSHRLTPYRNPEGGRHVRSQFDQVEADIQMEQKLTGHPRDPEIFLGNAGDVLVWHEELVHGGTPIRNMNLTRKSLVTHYWGASSVNVDQRRRHNSGWYLKRDQQRV